MSPYTDGRPDPTIPELLYPAETGPRSQALREDHRRARLEAEREAKRWAHLAEAAHWVSAYLSKSRTSNAQALDDLVHDMPSGPHAKLLRLALLSSTDLMATAEGVGQAAEAISEALQQITPVTWDD